jgi:hypothetical protein
MTRLIGAFENVRVVAHKEYQDHLSSCEICVEVLEGLHGKSKQVFA